VKDDAPIMHGRRRETLAFDTGLARQPRATVTVLVDLKPPVNLPVDRLVLKPEPTGGSAASVFTSVRADLDPSALRVEARPEGLEASVAASASPRILTLRVGWKGGPLRGGVVILSVGDERVRLPVEVQGDPAGDPATRGSRPR
jgi:hypothetical protein